jgi:hypothetical protein
MFADNQIINDMIKENTPYDYRDYMCVFENASYEIPPEYFGPLYTLSSDFTLRKQMCENQTKHAGAEGGLYIKRSDWIDPNNKTSVCGIYDLDDNRMLTDKGDKRQFPSKTLCDMFNKPRPDPTNNNNLIVSKVHPPDVLNPVTDYDLKKPRTDDKKSMEVRENTILIVLLLIAILYMFYVLKFQVERPYHLYDTAKKLFFNRVLFTLLLLGLYIYFFCPSGTCFIPQKSSNILKNTNFESHRIMCDNLKNFRAKRSIEVINTCDTLLNYSDQMVYPCNKAINIINNNTSRNIYDKIYTSFDGCNGCKVDNICVERYGHHTINFQRNLDNTYSKYCITCGMTFCNGNQCYSGKDAYYNDNCPNNIIIEHDMQATEYLKDKVVMQCKYCGQSCDIVT